MFAKIHEEPIPATIKTESNYQILQVWPHFSINWNVFQKEDETNKLKSIFWYFLATDLRSHKILSFNTMHKFIRLGWLSKYFEFTLSGLRKTP